MVDYWIQLQLYCQLKYLFVLQFKNLWILFILSFFKMLIVCYQNNSNFLDNCKSTSMSILHHVVTLFHLIRGAIKQYDAPKQVLNFLSTYIHCSSKLSSRAKEESKSAIWHVITTCIGMLNINDYLFTSQGFSNYAS